MERFGEAFAPRSEYVAAGTELGQTLFRHNIRTVVNIGLPATGYQTLTDPFTKSGVTIHEFC